MTDILAGLQLLFTVELLGYLLFGLVVGFVVGVLPGFDSANAAALFLPFSIGLSTEAALLLMGGIYAGASFAGAIPAILLNIPGTAGAAATTLDGYPMARQGNAALAIGIGRAASTIGGVLAALFVVAVIGPMAQFALNFRSPDMFVIAALGMLIIGTVSGRDPLKGVISAVAGLLVATMSASPTSGLPRFTLGFPQLYESVPFVPILIGMFAFSQVLIFASSARERGHEGPDETGDVGTIKPSGGILSTLVEEWRTALRGVGIAFRHKRLILQSSVIGIFVGVMPGLGPAVGNFLSYGVARKTSKTPELFGTGNPEGIIASETTDNAIVSATMIPTLALGVPGSGMAAIMLASIYLHGLLPGPRLLSDNAPQLYAFLLGLALVSLLILPLGVLLAGPLSALVRLKLEYLLPAILLISTIGAFALRNSMFDVAITILAGIVAIALRQTGYPVVPFVLGIILGPIAEWNFTRSMRLNRGGLEIFYRSPTTRILLFLCAAVVISAIIGLVRGKGRIDDIAAKIGTPKSDVGDEG